MECTKAYHVQVFQWYRSEHDVPAIKMVNSTSSGIVENHSIEGRNNYTNKSDLVRKSDCIWCMACVSVCPPQAIKIDEENLDVHEKKAETTS